MPDLYFSITRERTLGWKHTCVPPAAELRNCNLVRQGVAILTITKNPYSWLLSLFRNPQHQYSGNASSLEAFLDRPWKTTRRDNVPRMLASPIELWNLKNRSYLALAELGAMNITTERIFAGPEAVIDTISEHFGIPRLAGEFRDYERSTKDHTKDSAYYRDYYLNEKWRNEIPPGAVERINAAVDRSLMKHFGYGLL